MSCRPGGPFRGRLRVHVSFIPRDTMLVRARIFQARQMVIPCGARFVHVEDAIPRGSTMLRSSCAYMFPATTKPHQAKVLTHSLTFFASILPKGQVAVLANIVKSIVAVPLASILLRILSTIKPVLQASPPACKSTSATGTHARGEELVDKPKWTLFRAANLHTFVFVRSHNRNLVYYGPVPQPHQQLVYLPSKKKTSSASSKGKANAAVVTLAFCARPRSWSTLPKRIIMSVTAKHVMSVCLSVWLDRKRTDGSGQGPSRLARSKFGRSEPAAMGRRRTTACVETKMRW
jgi:hypothetical protein